MHIDDVDFHSMSLPELEQALARLLHAKEAKDHTKLRELALVNTAVCRALHAATGEDPKMPIAVVQKLNYWRAFKRGAALVELFLTRHYKPKGQADRLKGYVILLENLVRWMQEAGVPVTHRTIVHNLERVPSAMDLAFPGYAQSGMLSVAMRK